MVQWIEYFSFLFFLSTSRSVGKNEWCARAIASVYLLFHPAHHCTAVATATVVAIYVIYKLKLIKKSEDMFEKLKDEQGRHTQHRVELERKKY